MTGVHALCTGANRNRGVSVSGKRVPVLAVQGNRAGGPIPPKPGATRGAEHLRATGMATIKGEVQREWREIGVGARKKRSPPDPTEQWCRAGGK